ncbi:cell adhesion molecule CEACAM3 [Dasypus novemcinctus]|uniref:cell adhesion molecule CEACAM3 n=1 Tax=Dasypus novemcinctus TaxID=9361 RepID=UPI000C830649|nr:carcinoembryonic antigen-related cell adhesion molecule 3 [Dasypus novemcinctus]
MESPSGPPRRKCIPWQGPLLTVSLLIFWSWPITAQLTIESVPADAAEGNDVLLCVHNQPENPVHYNWYKGEKMDPNYNILAYVTNTQQTSPGPAHSGRETIYPNGSLLLQKVTQSDSGIYTLLVIKRNLQGDAASGQIRVYHGASAGAIAGIVTGVLAGLALTAVLGWFLLCRDSAGAKSQEDLREPRPPACPPGPSCPHNPAPLVPLHDSRAAVPIYEELLNRDTNTYCQINPKAKVAPYFPQ